MRIALLLLLAGMLGSCALSPRWQGPVTDHFDGYRFYNADPFPHDFLDLIDAMLKTRRPEWFADGLWQPGDAPRKRVQAPELLLTWVNHATVLIQVDGLNVLTDPIWSDRASPVAFAGPKRFHPPGIRFEELPPIDLVIVSHSHFDHMDKATLRRLQKVHDPLFVVPAGNRVLLQGFGLTRVKELDWQQSLTLQNGCQLIAQPVQHWSNRRILPSDKNASLWAGFVLQTTGGPVYFGGDTGYAGHFAETGRSHGPMRAALLPIGAYIPRWFMKWQHMSPAEAVQAHGDLASAFSLAIHWGTFQLAAEGRYQARDDLAESVRAAGLAPQTFVAPPPGQVHSVAALSSANPDCRGGKS